MKPNLVRAIAAHTIPERPPLEVSAGEVVAVGERDTEWPTVVLVTCEAGSGWVPSRLLSATAGEAEVIAAYDTTELATTAGEVLEVVEVDDESGWRWCRSTSGREGWVPSRTLGPLDASRTG